MNIYKPVRCGIVLAGGDGKRLKPLIHRLRGEALPKQYVNFFGARSMLEHTFRRAEKLISPKRLFTVVSKGHLSHAEPRRQLSSRTHGVMQPKTERPDQAFCSLIHLYKLRRLHCGDIPSDHSLSRKTAS